MVFNTGPYTVLPDNSILITANMQSETGFPSSHQLKSYVASKSRLKLAACAVVSVDAGLLVIINNISTAVQPRRALYTVGWMTNKDIQPIKTCAIYLQKFSSETSGEKNDLADTSANSFSEVFAENSFNAPIGGGQHKCLFMEQLSADIGMASNRTAFRCKHLSHFRDQ